MEAKVNHERDYNHKEIDSRHVSLDVNIQPNLENCYQEQELPGTNEDYHHGGQGGPQEEGVKGAIHVSYGNIFPLACEQKSTKFGMIVVWNLMHI